MQLAWQLVILAAVVVLMVTVIVPWLLRRAFGLRPMRPDDWRQRVVLRYDRLGMHPWMFAWFKTRLDPMFRELPDLLKQPGKMETIFDLGCGYGVAGCALLEWLPQARIWGVDPSARRVRRAGAAFGERGEARHGAAPEIPFPDEPHRFDAVFVLDVIHYIVLDADLARTLRRIHEKLNDGGYLFLRANVPPAGTGTWYWNWEAMRRKLTGAAENHRSVQAVRDAISGAGFEIAFSGVSGGNPELHWFIANPSALASASTTAPA